MYNILIKYCLLAIIITTFTNCNMYSFTGASIPAEAQTISVQYFPNKALNVNPELSYIFTEKLKKSLPSGELFESREVANLIFTINTEHKKLFNGGHIQIDQGVLSRLATE